MNTNRKLALVAVTALTASTGLSAAATAETTVVSFGVVSGVLSISQANSGADVDLGDATFSITGSSVEGSLNAVTVTDNQALGGVWCVSVSLDDDGVAPLDEKEFTDGGSETIPGSAAKMWIAATDLIPAVDPPGTAVMSVASAYTTGATGLSMGTGGVLVNGVTIAGGGSISYTPKMTVTVPASTPVGTYSGVVTHTASTTCT